MVLAIIFTSDGWQSAVYVVLDGAKPVCNKGDLYLLLDGMDCVDSKFLVYGAFLIENKTIKIKKKYAKWLRFNHGEVLVTIYVILLVLILREFWYFYGPKLGF